MQRETASMQFTRASEAGQPAPWEDDHQADELNACQQYLSEQVQSSQGWHRVHYPSVHKAESIQVDTGDGHTVPAGFYGDHDDNAIRQVAWERR